MRTMPDPEEVRCQIRSAFPSRPFFGAVIGDCKCDECTELEKSLRHQKWDALGDETMDSQFGSLPLLTPEAFATFLPAWLARSLEDLDAKEQKFREWTLYAIGLYHIEEDGPDELSRQIGWLRQRADRLTPEQIEAVATLLHLIEQCAPVSEWDRESIKRGLDLVWER